MSTVKLSNKKGDSAMNPSSRSIQEKKTNIEVEFRSIFSKSRYDELASFLNRNAKSLGEDDKDVYFFIFPDKLLKVVNNVSKKTAKVVLKLTKIGQGSAFEEIEVPISPADIGNAVRIFTFLGCDNIMRSFQQRHNYLYKGVELALKYSDHWGYHLELEIVINDSQKKEEAEAKISIVAEELGVHLMSNQELKEFTDKAEADYKKNGGNL